MAGRHRRRRPRRRWHDDAARALLAVLVASMVGAGLQAVEHVGGRVQLAPRPPMVAGPPPLQPVIPAPAPTIAPPMATVPAVAPTTTTRPPPVTTRPPPKPPPPPPPVEACPSSGFGGVRPHVAAAGHHIAAMFGVTRIGGVGARSNRSDHPLGLALDFFVDRATGDRLAAYVLDNRDRLAVTYVIWRQRINLGSGWESMPDRGGATANHMDHVHVSFRPTGSGARLTC